MSSRNIGRDFGPKRTKLPVAAKLRSRLDPARLIKEAERISGSPSSYDEHPDRVRGNVEVITLSCEGRKPLFHVEKHRRVGDLRYIQSLLKNLGGQIHNARIMKIPSGSTLLPHHDGERSFEFGILRLIAPVIYEKEASFAIRGRRIPMRPGELWWVDVGQTHEFSVAGKKPALFLVVDIGLSKSLFSRFPAKLRSLARERATFECKATEFFDSTLRGEYALPYPKLGRLIWPAGIGHRSASHLRIESSSKRKSRLILAKEKHSLVRDSEGRIRIRGDAPGLFLEKAGTTIRLERRGILRIRERGPASYYSISLRLDRVGNAKKP